MPVSTFLQYFREHPDHRCCPIDKSNVQYSLEGELPFTFVSKQKQTGKSEKGHFPKRLECENKLSAMIERDTEAVSKSSANNWFIS